MPIREGPDAMTLRGAGKARALALLAALALAGACSDEGPVAGPGPLTATVVSPNGAEGAAVLTIFGEGIEGVSALEGRVFSEPRGDSLRVVVIGDGGTLRFAVSVSDTTRTPSGVVLEVAGPDDELRTAVSGYSVEFAR